MKIVHVSERACLVAWASEHAALGGTHACLDSSGVGEGLFTCLVCLLLQVMFEQYQCAGVYIAIQAVLTLYAQGKPCDVVWWGRGFNPGSP